MDFTSQNPEISTALRALLYAYMAVGFLFCLLIIFGAKDFNNRFLSAIREADVPNWVGVAMFIWMFFIWWPPTLKLFVQNVIEEVKRKRDGLD